MFGKYLFVSPCVTGAVTDPMVVLDAYVSQTVFTLKTMSSKRN